MSEIRDLSSVCRCCHAEGDLKPLDKSWLYSGNVVVFSRLLFETLGVMLSPPQCTGSNSICNNCIYELQQAADFKAKVVDCEKRFQEYCINELQPHGVKQELNLEATDEDSDGDNDLHEPSHLDDDEGDVKDVTKQEEMLPTEDDVIDDDKVGIGIDLTDDQKEEDNEKRPNTENGTLKKKKRHINKTNWIKCIDCDMLFATELKFNRHYGSKHMKRPQKTETHQCDYCRKEFKLKNVLRKHILMHLGLNKKFCCELCGLRFNDVTNLNKHKSGVHLKERPFACKICPKRYTIKKSLVIHQRHHAGIKPFKCILCPKSFTSSEYSKIHTLKHKSPFFFTCTQCKQPFRTRGELRIHFKIHIGNLPFKCVMCPRDFTNKYCLNRHIATHEGKKEFTCDVCCKTFATKDTLVRHKSNLHDPTKLEALSKRISAKCNICNRMVKDINKHKISHLERQYKCPDCDKAYPQISALNRHVKIFHLGRKYTCEECGKSYIQYRALQKHKEKKHQASTIDE